MSKSYKKPIIKDRPRNFKKSTIYWRTIRRINNNKIQSFKNNLEELLLPKEKSIINDYDYSDYTFDCKTENNCYCIKVYGFKKCKYK